MAKCPKCGYKLKLWDISQFCPQCKTNMRFYNFEENFYRDAKNAELTQAAFHIKVRRATGAFLGSKLMIARVALGLLPLIMLLIPAASFHFEIPFKSVDYSAGLLGFVNLLTSGDLNYILTMLSSDLLGAQFSAMGVTLLSYGLTVVFAVLVLFGSLLCFVSIKNMQKINCAFAGGGIIACVAAIIIMYVKIASFGQDGIISASAGFGLYAVAVGFAIVFAINAVVEKKGIPLKYDEGMEERFEIYKKVKSGEINIDDLPQPVVETAETRAIDEEIAKEENVKKALLERQGAATE